MKVKKILSSMLVAALAVCMTVPAMAVNKDPATGSPADSEATVTVNGGTAVGYEAYRLLDLVTGLKDHTGAKADALCGKAEGPHNENCYNYNYTVNSKYTSILRAAIAEADPTGSASILTEDDRSIVTYLSGLEDDADTVRAFANAVYDAIKEDGSISADATAEANAFDGISQGYYLIVETGELAAGDTRSLVMLDTQGQDDIEIIAKDGQVSLTKKVMNDEATDFESAEGKLTSDGWTDYADANMKDDKVWFQLKGTLPDNFGSADMKATYETYKYVFHDTFTNLTLDESSLKVYVYDSASAASGTIVDSSKYQFEKVGDTGFTVTFDDLLAENALGAGVSLTKDSVIVVYYQASLADSAVLGGAGNPNTAYIEYDADPYVDVDNTKQTKPDYAAVFSYELDIDKQDEEGAALAGADFTLEYWDGSKWAPTGIDYEGKADNSGLTATEFNFKGLDVGKYRITEIKVPQGYAEADPIYFEVSASYKGTDTSADAFAVESLTVQVADYDDAQVESGEGFKADSENVFTPSEATGIVSTIVENIPGTRMPSTGGAGVFALYAAGGALVLCAVVVILKRRNDSAE